MDFNSGYKKGFISLTYSHWLLSADVRAYGSGRAAILDIVEYLAKSGVKRFWIPAWQCSELVMSLKKSGLVQIHFYNINQNFMPDISFLQGLDSQADAILIVDYFASVHGEQFEQCVNSFSGAVVLDAVHSWLLSDISGKLRSNIFVVSGFRKLFWKIAGALVTGVCAQDLPRTPALIRLAAPGFPRNFSLSPRFGILTKLLLALLNLSMLDEIAKLWRSANEERGVLDSLRCPVMLMEKSSVEGYTEHRWEWPDLYAELDLSDKENALHFKRLYRVVKKRHL